MLHTDSGVSGKDLQLIKQTNKHNGRMGSHKTHKAGNNKATKITNITYTICSGKMDSVQPIEI